MSDWPNFIQDKLKISIYLSWDKYKESQCNSLLYYELTMPCCMENSVDPDQLASELDLHCFQLRFLYLVAYSFSHSFLKGLCMELVKKGLS